MDTYEIGTKVETSQGTGIYRGIVEVEDTVTYFGMRAGSIKKWYEVELEDVAIFRTQEINLVLKSSGRKLVDCL